MTIIQPAASPGAPRAVLRPMARALDMAPGESLHSWTTRFAAHTQLDYATLLDAIGLTHHRREKAPSNFYGITLPPDRAAAITATTRIDPAILAASVLSTFNGHALNLTDYDPTIADATRRLGGTQWALLSSSFACPACLTDTGHVWPTTWKLPWHFTCPTHHLYLVSTCPGCHQPLHLGRRSAHIGPALPSLVPDASACTNPLPTGRARRGAHATSCTHPYADLPHQPMTHADITTAQTELLDALHSRPQHWWNDLRALTAITLGVLDPDTASELLPGIDDTALTALEHVADQRAARREARATTDDHRRGPRTRTFTGTPDTPALLAPAATLALAVVNAAHPDPHPVTLSADHVLTALRAAARANLPQSLIANLRDRGATDDLLRFVGAASGRNIAVHTDRGNYADLTCDQLPRLWPLDEESDLAADLVATGLSTDMIRAHMSLLAAKLLTRGSWQKAADSIGFPADRNPAKVANYTLTAIRRRNLDTRLTAQLSAELTALAHQPAAERIDYAARRRATATLTAIPAAGLRSIAEAAGQPLVCTDTRRMCAAAWIWHNHSANPLSEFPGFTAAANRETAVEMYRRFRLLVDAHPALAAALTDHATTNYPHNQRTPT